MKHAAELREAINANKPTGITIKETSSSLVLYAPGYSSHSAIFDKAFDVARIFNISYRGSGHNWGDIYTITFKQTAKTI